MECVGEIEDVVLLRGRESGAKRFVVIVVVVVVIVIVIVVVITSIVVVVVDLRNRRVPGFLKISNEIPE